MGNTNTVLSVYCVLILWRLPISTYNRKIIIPSLRLALQLGFQKKAYHPDVVTLRVF